MYVQPFHMKAFSLLHTGNTAAAASAFLKSVRIGNETDWQSLIELTLDHPGIQLT